MLCRQIIQKFSTNSIKFKSTPLKHGKKRGTSSNQWLSRQLSDPYVEKSKMLNYRCRSAFKLIEMNEKYNFFAPGQLIVDCGAAPGSWTQVAVKSVNSDESQNGVAVGKVVSVDKQPIYPIEGAIILGNLDFTLPTSQQKVLDALDGQKANGVISDMAPSATGVRDLDNENIINLCYTALKFALQISEVGAFIIVKLWQCGETKKLETDIARFYKNVRVVKPNASRSDSAEIFLLGRDFKGLKKNE